MKNESIKNQKKSPTTAAAKAAESKTAASEAPQPLDWKSAMEADFASIRGAAADLFGKREKLQASIAAHKDQIADYCDQIAQAREKKDRFDLEAREGLKIGHNVMDFRHKARDVEKNIEDFQSFIEEIENILIPEAEKMVSDLDQEIADTLHTARLEKAVEWARFLWMAAKTIGEQIKTWNALNQDLIQDAGLPRDVENQIRYFSLQFPVVGAVHDAFILPSITGMGHFERQVRGIPPEPPKEDKPSQPHELKLSGALIDGRGELI